MKELMNFTEEDIKRAFSLGSNSTDKYAKQKGYPTSQDECVEFLIKEKDSQRSSVIHSQPTEGYAYHVRFQPSDDYEIAFCHMRNKELQFKFFDGGICNIETVSEWIPEPIIFIKRSESEANGVCDTCKSGLKIDLNKVASSQPIIENTYTLPECSVIDPYDCMSPKICDKCRDI